MKPFLLFIIVLVGIIWGIMYISKGHKPLSGINSKIILQITSSAFANNATIPTTYTCSGSNINPPLSFSSIPGDTRSMALILDDPDASGGTFNHWVVYDIPASTRSIPQDSIPPGIVARNSAGTNAYVGPCPPSGEHKYVFTLYALDVMLPSDSIFNKTDLLEAMNTHILDKAQLFGKFTKK